jgi:ABC-type sulfate transport system permease component
VIAAVAAAIVGVVTTFVAWCCVIVGARYERLVDELER